jgi:hypothetical protein
MSDRSLQNRLWLLVGGLFVLIGLVYSWVTPPFEGPDEPQHFAYIEWLVNKQSFPLQGDEAWETPVKQEASQPPLYYLLAAIPAQIVGVTNPSVIYRPNPSRAGSFPRTFVDNDNHAIHYPTDAKPLQGGWLALYLARGVTLLFGLLLLVGVYSLAREVAPDAPQVWWGAVLLVAVIPQVVFLSNVVSNDIPVAALSTWTLWAVARLLRDVRWQWGTAVGILYGLAILTKASALTLAVPIGFAFLWLFWSRRDQFWQVFWVVGAAVFSTLLVAGWWFGRGWLLYGSPLGLETHDEAAWAIGELAKLGKFSHRWWEVFRSFWAWFGWGTIRPDFRLYPVLLGLCLLAVVGWGIRLVRWRRGRSGQTRSERTGWNDRTAVLSSLLLIAFLATAVFLEIWMRRVTAPYGRLMYPVLPIVAIFLVVGWQSIHPRFQWLPLALLFFVLLYSPKWVIQPAYALPSMLTAEEIAAIEPVGWQFGPTPDQPIAELLSLEPLSRSVSDGGVFPVRVCWRVLALADRDYAMLIHVIGPENRLITARHIHPGVGRYPTSIWQPGNSFCDVVQMVTPGNLTQTMVYLLEIGFIDLENDERLTGYSQNGEPLGNTFLSNVRVEVNPDNTFFSLAPELGAIQLLGSEATTAWQPGRTYPITLEWGLASPVTQDYQTFVHLRDAANNNVAQADGPPLAGWYPTSWWEVGEKVVDNRTFSLPDDVTPGPYQLVVGWYDLSSEQRVGAEHTVGTIEVRP